MDWITQSAAVLLDVSVRATLLALVVALALFVFRVRSPRARHAVWLGVLLAMLAMPVLRSVLPPIAVPVPALSWSVPPASAAGPPGQALALTDTAALTDADAIPLMGSASSADTSPMPVSTALAIVYVAGVLVFGWRLVRSWSTTHTLIRRSRPVAELGRTGPCPVLESEDVHSPMTVGLVRPRVVLPATWRAWSPEQLRAVLAHEGAHARTRDPLVAGVAHVNRVLFWFHPLAWWLGRTLAAHAEEACDDAGVAAMGERRAYAEVLVSFARAVQFHGARLTWHGAGVAGHGSLSQRIERVLRAAPEPRLSRGRAFATAVCCLAATMMVAAAADRGEPVPGTGGSEPRQAPVVTSPSSPEGVAGETPVPSAPVEPAVPVPPAVPALPVTSPEPPSTGGSPTAPIGSAARTIGSVAQAASVSGTVTDQTGLVVPGATVGLMRQGADGPDRTEAHFTTSDTAGRFAFGTNPPGSYVLEVSLAGFKTLTRPNLQLGVGDRIDAPVSLVIGSATETVTIEPGATEAADPELPAELVEQLAALPEQPEPYEELARILYAQGFFTESAAANDRAAELTTMRQEAGDGNALGVGGRVLPPRVIRRVEPGYPAGANPGLVILEATIGADGQMHDVRVLRSVPGLDEAATIALWKWRFAPTLLNGSAVPVVLTVTMNFVG